MLGNADEMREQYIVTTALATNSTQFPDSSLWTASPLQAFRPHNGEA